MTDRNRTFVALVAAFVGQLLVKAEMEEEGAVLWEAMRKFMPGIADDIRWLEEAEDRR